MDYRVVDFTADGQEIFVSKLARSEELALWLIPPLLELGRYLEFPLLWARQFFDLRLIFSRNTRGGIGAIVETMFASLSASSLLDLAMWRSSQTSKLPSSRLYMSRYAIMFSDFASHSFIVC